MLSENRKFHFIAELKLHKSRVLKMQTLPKEDVINWLFLTLDNIQYSFVYKIENPENAEYEKPFRVFLAFTAFELLKSIIRFNQVYPVMRGQEEIGEVEILEIL